MAVSKLTGRRDEILARRAAGETWPSIAESFSMHESSLRKFMVAASDEHTLPSADLSPEERIRQIFEVVRDNPGMLRQDVARRCGVRPEDPRFSDAWKTLRDGSQIVDLGHGEGYIVSGGERERKRRYEPPIPVLSGAANSSGWRAVTSTESREWGDIRKLLADKGLKQEEWVVTGARVNKWADYDQLRVDIVPTLDLIVPARTDGWVAPKRTNTRGNLMRKHGGKTVAFFGDQHAPHQDEGLHAAACQWLAEYQPDELYMVGDLLDYDAVSRHPGNPEWSATLQECIDQGYSLARAYRTAAPDARIVALDGNHEERLRAVVLKQIASLYKLRPGVLPGEQEPQPLLSTRHLLRLDELAIEWIDPKGSYEHAQVKVSEELACRHGWIAKKGSGASALATIDHLRHSCVIGHTHRQSVVHHTAHDINGSPRTLLGAETGTMAKIRGGLGYAVAPDWQQGFATATVWPDGRFKLDLATYVDGTLLWRDWRCTP